MEQNSSNKTNIYLIIIIILLLVIIGGVGYYLFSHRSELKDTSTTQTTTNDTTTNNTTDEDESDDSTKETTKTSAEMVTDEFISDVKAAAQGNIKSYIVCGNGIDCTKIKDVKVNSISLAGTLENGNDIYQINYQITCADTNYCFYSPQFDYPEGTTDTLISGSYFEVNPTTYEIVNNLGSTYFAGVDVPDDEKVSTMFYNDVLAAKYGNVASYISCNINGTDCSKIKEINVTKSDEVKTLSNGNIVYHIYYQITCDGTDNCFYNEQFDDIDTVNHVLTGSGFYAVDSKDKIVEFLGNTLV